MSWSWFSQLSDAFKKRVGKYLINRYLGPFLEEGVLLNQLSVDGPIKLRDVALNTLYINALLEDSEVPLEFIDGYIEELSVTVPMSNILRENCTFEISGLTLTLQVKKRSSHAQISSSSMFYSMYESFSSLNLAEDCLKADDLTDNPGKGSSIPPNDSSVLGVELLAEAIDSIIRRVQVLLKDTTIRLEYVPTVAPKGLAVELRVGKVGYAGEPIGSDSTMTNSTTKRISLEDVTIFSDEFSFRKDYPTSSDEGDSSPPREDGQPLKLASLAGRNEVVVRFAELNHFGLPRCLEEVELNFGGVLLHVFPHQIHTVTELLSAVAASRPQPEHCSTIRNRDPPACFENVLQQSLILEPVGLSGHEGWSSPGDEDLTSRSSEFVAMPRVTKSHRHAQSRTEENENPSPKILIRASSLFAVIVERDEGIAKLGGESSKHLALDRMHDVAATFFSVTPRYIADTRRVRGQTFGLANDLHVRLSPMSHFQIISSPISVTIEQRSAEASNAFAENFLSKISVVLAQLSVKEILWPLHRSSPADDSAEINPILEFDAPIEPNPYQKKPDFKLVITESLIDDDKNGDQDRKSANLTTINLRLNPCSINFDLGLIDRTYTIINFSDLDPTSLVTPTHVKSSQDCSEQTSSWLVNVISSQVHFNFFVAKPDMRNPPEIQISEFVSNFWSRAVHSEVFQIDLVDLDLSVTQDDPESEVVVSLATNRVAINFQESCESERLPILVARKSQANAENPSKRAGLVKVTTQLGPLTEARLRKIRFSEVHKQKTTYFGTLDDGQSTSEDNSSFVLREALEFGRHHCNLCLDLEFDELSLVLPDKHVYEVIYNRFGNDLLLWTPVYLRVKEFLFHQPIQDPLKDPDGEFLHCSSGAWQQKTSSVPTIEMSESFQAGMFHLFPKVDSPGLTIHTDTYVGLAVNQTFVAICSPTADGGERHNIFSAVLSHFSLQTSVGLERGPDICLLGTAVREIKISFGKTASRFLNLRGTHFNDRPTGEDSTIILERTRWHQFSNQRRSDLSEDLLQLTSKILFDVGTNVKSIDLAMIFSEASIFWNLSTGRPQWIDWILDFFTVVEYPVVGYVPPAILTQMKFDVRHSTLDVMHSVPTGRLILALGQVHVNCNLLDTGRDVSIGIIVEDVAIYVTIDPHNYLTTSVCFCDLDFLDLGITLTDDTKPVLDVHASCNLLRLRTCADTLTHLVQVASSVVASATTLEDRGSPETSQSEVVNDMPASVEGEDIIPDLADAMAELDAAKKTIVMSPPKVTEGKSQLRLKKGGQLFFFPDESQKLVMEGSAFDGAAMTESFYEGRSKPTTMDSSDDSLEGFFIVDPVGTGFSKNGEATVRPLGQDPVVFVDNHFSVPEMSIDYLKTPPNFPDFQSRITLKKFSILWQIFGGKDLCPATSFTLVGDAKEKSIILSSSQIVGKGGLVETLKTRGGPQRNEHQLIEVHVSNVSMQHEIYPDDCRQSSRQIVVVRSFEILDRISSSEINKLLHLYSTTLRPRQSNCNMFSLKCVNLRLDGENDPIPEESNVSVSLQPIRINIDQDTLIFVIDFFSSLFPSLASISTEMTIPTTTLGAEDQSVTIRYSRSVDSVEFQCAEVGEEVTEELKFDEDGDDSDQVETSSELAEDDAVTDSASLDFTASKSRRPYFRTFIFSRDVPIRIDYSAKYLDLSQGTLAGILTGLTSLNCSELTLKRVYYRDGIAGLDKLLTLLITDWLADVRQNQIPQILGGVGPMHSVLQLVQGIKDLILMPVEQYQKDGRIFRGLQRGAHSFTSSTAMSLLDMTNRFLGVIKFAAELAFDIMAPEATIIQGKALAHSGSRRRHRGTLRRPNDMREGMFNAFAIVQEGFDETARSLAYAVATEHSRRGLTGAVGGILRQVPSNLVRPVILATTATTNVLEGVKCHVAPEARRDDEDKYKEPQQ